MNKVDSARLDLEEIYVAKYIWREKTRRYTVETIKRGGKAAVWRYNNYTMSDDKLIPNELLEIRN